jgi:chromate transporter
LVMVFGPLSLMSIGGGQAILADIQHQSVDVQHWLTADQFLDDFAISRASPGPTMLLVSLIGWQVAGAMGVIAATIAIFLPSSILIYFLARIWRRHRGKQWQIKVERGLAPIAAGLVLSGSISILRTSGSGLLGLLVTGLSWAALTRAKVHPLVLLIAGGAVFALSGVIGSKIKF